MRILFWLIVAYTMKINIYIYIYFEKQIHTQEKRKEVLRERHTTIPLKSAPFPHPPKALSDDGL